MPGMGRGLQVSNPTMVDAFRAAVGRQGVVVVLLALLVALAFAIARTVQAHQDLGGGDSSATTTRGTGEPAGRRFLRISFGCLWIFDGLLQLQSGMPVGLTSQVIAPSEVGQPHFLASLISSGTVIWQNHPVEAAAAAVWIQVGIGAWLLVGTRGGWSRVAGLASIGWALVVWVLGEGIGMMLTSSGSFLLGAPGAVVFYAVAGGLVALPERLWSSPRLGTGVVRFMGAVFVLGAVVQTLPGRGFWNGSSLASMGRQMSAMHQPGPLASLVRDFGTMAGANGFAVNLVVVVTLAAIGVALLVLPESRAGLIGAVVASVMIWVLVEDLGFLGGVGTDPNSGIPMVLVLVGGRLALTRAPATAAALVEDRLAPVGASAGHGAGLVPASAGPESEGSLPGRIRGVTVVRWVAIAAAIGVTTLGAIPMAFASFNPRADPIVAEAIAGSAAPEDTPGFGFSLVNQYSHRVTLAGFRGRVVLLTFLDPVCTTDCPLIAQELKATDALLGSNASRVEIVAVVANPLYHSVAAVDAFDRQEQLNGLSNWQFVTGSVPALARVWSDYGIGVQVVPGGGMVAHSDAVFIIDASGRIRWIINSDPGAGTSTTRSSFASLFTGYLQRVLPPR